jgi:hypothetical protein
MGTHPSQSGTLEVIDLIVFGIQRLPSKKWIVLDITTVLS